MKLAELRKIAVKKNLRIRFSLPDGKECLVDERGVARVAALRAAPDFNLEEEAAQARSFTVEPAAPGEKAKARTLTPDALAALVAAAGDSREERED